MSCPGRDPLEESVLAKIKPSKLQVTLLDRLYGLIKSRLDSCLHARGLRGTVEAQGSYAKGTLLSDKWEIDVFVLFDGVDREWIQANSLDVVTGCLEGLPTVRRYAQHPYVTVTLYGLEADVVPAVKLERPTPHGMGVDRTPFHTRYIKEKLRRNPCLADDVRLLKSFLKGIGAYGAETHVGGFSGYLAELLTVHYGGFRGVLEAASKWDPGRGIYVDPEGVGDRGELKRKYAESPLIVVDPVDPARNAAAAVRLDKLATFILAARLYLRSPSRAFFHPFSEELDGSMRYRGYKVDPGRVGVVVFRGDLYNHPPESVWGRLYRASKLLSGELELMGFRVARHWYHTDEATYGVIVVEVENPSLPQLEAFEGPQAWIPGRADSFAAKHASEGMPVWVTEDGRLVAWRVRRVTRLEDALARVAGQLPAPPGSRLQYAGLLEGVGEPWRGIITRGYLKSFPSWIASPRQV